MYVAYDFDNDYGYLTTELTLQGQDFDYSPYTYFDSLTLNKN